MPVVNGFYFENDDKYIRRLEYDLAGRGMHLQYDNGEEELYDHQSDPNEWNNRAGDPAMAQVKADLRSELEKILKATRE